MSRKNMHDFVQDDDVIKALGKKDPTSVDKEYVLKKVNALFDKNTDLAKQTNDLMGAKITHHNVYKAVGLLLAIGVDGWGDRKTTEGTMGLAIRTLQLWDADSAQWNATACHLAAKLYDWSRDDAEVTEEEGEVVCAASDNEDSSSSSPE